MWDLIPFDILGFISRLLPNEDQYNCLRVCKKWNSCWKLKYSYEELTYFTIAYKLKKAKKPKEYLELSIWYWFWKIWIYGYDENALLPHIAPSVCSYNSVMYEFVNGVCYSYFASEGDRESDTIVLAPALVKLSKLLKKIHAANARLNNTDRLLEIYPPIIINLYKNTKYKDCIEKFLINSINNSSIYDVPEEYIQDFREIFQNIWQLCHVDVNLAPWLMIPEFMQKQIKLNGHLNIHEYNFKNLSGHFIDNCMSLIAKYPYEHIIKYNDGFSIFLIYNLNINDSLKARDIMFEFCEEFSHNPVIKAMMYSRYVYIFAKAQVDIYTGEKTGYLPSLSLLNSFKDEFKIKNIYKSCSMKFP